ncbi:MAG TPA: hypothetical protein VH008_01965 [Pseudonocardia sp.]|jgi:hypothetical protein|nr:hypothetical protein [Pseudonocardia sp.]
MNTHIPPTDPISTDPSRENPPVSTAPNDATGAVVVLVDEHQEQTERHAQQLLYRAADQLHRHGWRRGAYWPDSYLFARYIDGDPCCALGALAVADGITSYDAANWALTARPGLALAVDVLTAQINRDREPYGHVVDVADWNDDLERTATEVITTMRAAAQRLGQSAETSASARSGAPSAKNAHQAGPAVPNHQRSTSEGPHHV